MGFTVESQPASAEMAVAEPTPPRRSGRAAFLRTWRFWIVVGLVLAMAVGWSLAIYGLNVSAERGATLAEVSRTNATLHGDLDAVTQERDSLESTRKSAADAVKKREDAAKTREDEVKKREDTVKQREDAVTQQEKIVAQNTITEGNWAVGVDIQPGTYRTKEAVSGQCYWAILADPNGSDIVENDIVTGGRPTVTLKGGQFFTTKRCGEWIKV